MSHEDLIGPKRLKNIAFARHVAVYLANDMCEMTTPWWAPSLADATIRPC